MRARKQQAGQAAVELVAILPALLLVVLVCVQLVVVGYGLWTAGNASRAGARAAHVGGDARAAARSAIPTPLLSHAQVRDRRALAVSLRVPWLLPAQGRIPLRSRTALDPAAGG